MTAPDRKHIRLDLDERRARGVHAAIREALNAQLLAGEHRDAARDVLEQLDSKVPGWLQAGPIAGEAGYLVAAEAVLRALVAGEDRGRRSLSESELLRELGDAKPLGSTADDILARMRREKLIRVDARHGDERSITAESAGRRFLHRDSGVADDTWTVRDADALLDLIYAERRPGHEAHRPSVQAIGRLDATALDELVDALVALGLLKAPDLPASLTTTRELTHKGYELAREHWQSSAPPGIYRSALDGPPAPPLPFQRRLRLRIARDDRGHPPLEPDSYCSRAIHGAPVAWLQASSKTKLFATLKRDGAVQWTCDSCNRTWIVYLQGFTADDEPAYADPAAATYNRALWRPTFRYR